MHQKRFTKIVLIAFALLLLGIGYVTFNKKPTSVAKSDIEVASQTLINYFDLLNNKQYGEAIKYHGSDCYDTSCAGLEEIQRKGRDPIAAIKGACEISGWQCLKIKNILSQEQISPTKFKFIVQFQNNNGTLYQRGPCCGSTEGPIRKDFPFVVQKIGNDFMIMTPPDYRA